MARRRLPLPSMGRRGMVPSRNLAQDGAIPARADSRGSSLVDSGVYLRGERVASPKDLASTLASLREQEGRIAWMGLYRPAEPELNALAAEFDLHELAVEDAVLAHQRPKLERYGSTLFVVLRAARYVDAREEVEFGELHLFIGRDFVITVRHSESPDLSAVRRRMERDPELLGRGTEAVLYAILDAVVDGYGPVLHGLENDIDEIETQVFTGDPTVSRRIYELSQEVVDVQRAITPLASILTGLTGGFQKYRVDEELQRYLRDVADHVTLAAERVENFRNQLRDILTVNATLVGQRQNEEMRALTEASYAQSEEVKKISSWAAILFAPSLVGGIYGMNFTHMPELDWRLGYPLALLLMLVLSVTLYAIFRRRGWL
ncbi:magnesium and cobalt transport protein CorA [Kineococcus radiotolerans]|uniref:Magnesium and cobalt transport protein CorA n=1 Tax=Kineococcus radiotolerans (strain ATCC BAA-149 / DSM 14245 / SRS30216) TaxID=266940 RepID=A6WF61_KINRD|nr:magnesium and cobalt transport protein CorA [Kineococcus radiotolerans]ABS05450.1 magnesium and cobalt transport protein CorA [Kineococcus radiotolerans SRS30216 = ATCC BAA-149]